MTKAFGYIRCSGLGQLSGDGPDRQREAIQTFADLNQIEIAEWFTESHTGTDLEGRPQFQRMRKALVSDGVHTVLIEKLDRLARDIIVQETILADFKKNSIDLFSATPGEDGLCGNDPTRTLIRQILGCFFEYERKMIVSKLNAARDRKRANGERMEGRLPYGMKQGEAKVLAQIQSMSAAGFAPSSIAATLNTQGIATRYNKMWHAATVSKILARQDTRQ